MKAIKPLIIALLFCSCSGQSETDELSSDAADSAAVESLDYLFASQLRDSDFKWYADSVYSDTVEYLAYDDNYDYPFMIVRGRNGMEETIVCDNLPEDLLQGAQIIINYSIQTFSEAGEGDGPGSEYYDDKIIDYKLLSNGLTLNERIAEVARNLCDPDYDLSEYVHSEIKCGISTNPGAHCVMSFVDSPVWIEEMDMEIAKISDELPKGGFCEGYEGARDGFYYEFMDGELPKFEFVEEGEMDFVYKAYPLPDVYQGSNILRISMIWDMYLYQYIYLIEVDYRWYIFAQDYCDCSA